MITKTNKERKRLRTVLFLVFVSVIFVVSVVGIYQQSSAVYDYEYGIGSNSDSDSNRSTNGKTTTTTTTTTCDIESALDRFDRTFDERRKARQDRVKSQLLAGTGSNVKPKLFWDMYEPEAICFSEERLGYRGPGQASDFQRYAAFGDGPKFTCGVDVMSSLTATAAAKKPKQQRDGDPLLPCLVYSIGSANKFEFEIAIQQLMGCETHTFDPTVPKEIFAGDNYTTFHQWGLGEDGVEGESRRFGKKSNWKGMSFHTIFQKLGHLQRTIDVLKIDCEGCEWATMPPLFDLIASGTVTVHQIQIEMHHIKGKVTSDMLHSFFEKMDNAKMRLVHKERNHWGCDGFRCLEYLFVSEEFLRTANEASVCGR